MQNEREQAASRLLELVYAAVDDAALWRQVPTELVRALDAEFAHLHLDAGAGQPVEAATHAQALEDYRAHRHEDPLLDPGLVGHMTQAQRAFFSHELIEDRELRASAYYNDFLRPQGNWFWAIGAWGASTTAATAAAPANIKRDITASFRLRCPTSDFLNAPAEDPFLSDPLHVTVA